MPFQTRPENARVVAELTATLVTVSIGATISYGELKKVAPRYMLQGKDRYLLQAAISKAEAECRCVFACVHGQGLKRLPADETSGVGSNAITSVRRKTKTAIKRMARVNSNSMSTDARQETSLKMAHLQILHGLADNRRSSTFVPQPTPDPDAGKQALRQLLE